MSLTQIDDRSALVLIDLQEGIVALPTIHHSQEVVARAAQLAAAFRARGLPIVLVNVAGVSPGRVDRPWSDEAPAPGWDELVAALEADEGDLRVTKTAWGAFQTTTLHDQLQQLGVTQIVLGGIATSMGVESTARSAHELGYNVVIAVDAITDVSAAAHEHTLGHVFPMIAETATTAELLNRVASVA